MMRKMIVVVLLACMLTATVALTSAAGCTILNTGMNNEYNGSYYISQAWAKAEATNNSYIRANRRTNFIFCQSWKSIFTKMAIRRSNRKAGK